MENCSDQSQNLDGLLGKRKKMHDYFLQRAKQKKMCYFNKVKLALHVHDTELNLPRKSIVHSLIPLVVIFSQE